jgi:hypothetical protein
MKSDFIEFIGQARKRRSEKFRIQFWVFLICLILSIFFWSLVRLSKDYYYPISFKLNFIQLPNNLKITSCSDSILVIKIKLQGFEFFSEEFIVKRERAYDLSMKNLRLMGSGENLRGYLLTGKIGREIISQFEFPGDVFYVTPDTLFFLLERPAIRRLPARTGVGASELKATPHDSITDKVQVKP